MLKRLHFILLAILSMILFLSACTVANPRLSNANSDAIEKALQSDVAASKKYCRQRGQQANMPDAVKKALMPQFNLPEDALPPSTSGSIGGVGDQQRFNITVNNVPANSFFMGLVKGTRYNMTVSPQVSGMISLDLKNVSIPEIMETTRQVYGFEYEQTSSGFRVLPRELETRIFTVNYLDVERNGQSNTAIASGDLTQSSSSQYSSSTFSAQSSRQTLLPTGNVCLLYTSEAETV